MTQPTHSAPSLDEIARIASARVENAPAEPTALTFSTISLNSSDVEHAGIFAALPGTRVHGASFASETPAAAILTDDAGLSILAEAGDRRPVLVVDDIRAVLGEVSAEIYGHPSADLTVLGVTGTSGKTTTTYLLEAGLMAAGHTVGIIGTTGTRIDGHEVATKLTTPESPTLQALFSRMRDEGVTHVVMEVSSHALSLGRVDGTTFAVAGFTNLSQDHLDFHPTMEDYFLAKARFFDPSSAVHAQRAVICVDDEWGQRMAGVAENPVLVGTHDQVDLDVSATRTKLDASGAQTLDITIRGASYTTELSLPGDFNVANAATAAAMAATADVDIPVFLRGVETAGVPGRMERIDEGQDFVVVVDYAHKPAAVAAVLETMRGQVEGRVGVIVGAGGDRDASKRPVMGSEGVKGADFVIVTDDNPRSEDPATIRAAVMEGARAEVDDQASAGHDVELREVARRSDAIDELIQWAQPGDAVIVTGKGHEVGQIVGDEVHHFDDREEVRRALAHFHGSTD